MTLGWDPASNLTSTTVGTAVTRYAYDADGQRILKITPTAVTAYLGATELTAPLPSGSATGTRHYTQAGSTVATRTGSAALTYLLGDLQGSATLSITSGPPASATVNRQRYTPYGASRGPANQLPLERGWLGQTEDDTTGLTYLNARYYDPATAQFLSPDPILNTEAPTTHNPYTYSYANPTTYTDPSGLAKGGGPAYCGGNPSCIAAATNGGAASIDGQRVAKGVRKQVKKPGAGGQPRRNNGGGGGGGGGAGSPSYLAAIAIGAERIAEQIIIDARYDFRVGKPSPYNAIISEISANVQAGNPVSQVENEAYLYDLSARGGVTKDLLTKDLLTQDLISTVLLVGGGSVKMAVSATLRRLVAKKAVTEGGSSRECKHHYC
jgi:RHS repeat-associated protein